MTSVRFNTCHIKYFANNPGDPRRTCILVWQIILVFATKPTADKFSTLSNNPQINQTEPNIHFSNSSTLASVSLTIFFIAPSKQIFFFFVEDDIEEIELLPVTLRFSTISGLRLPVDEQFSELSVIIDIPENELGLHNELMDNFELSR